MDKTNLTKYLREKVEGRLVRKNDGMRDLIM